MRAYVTGIGVRGPGLDGWATARAVLRGERDWAPGAAPALPAPASLSPNERRRAGLPVRLALAVAEEATRMAGLAPDGLRGVFGSANGEGVILHELLEELAAPAPALSPTRFHNSVHNAVAGYWAMAAGSQAPVTALGAHADTLAATLLKALAEVAAEGEPALCCAYDAPLPGPLAPCHPTGCAFAVALALRPEPGPDAVAALRGRWHPGPHAAWTEADGVVPPQGVMVLAGENPAARCLPLLRAVATGRATRLPLPLLGGALLLEVEPCWTAPPSPP